MSLEDEVNKCLANLTNAVKALKIATQELNNAGDRLEMSSQQIKPKLEIVKNEKIANSLAKGLSNSGDEE